VKVINDWNGVRYGESVISDNWKFGKKFPLPAYNIQPKSPGAVPLVKFDCEGRISILPNSPMGLNARVPFLNSAFEWIYKNTYDIVACGAEKRNMIMNELYFNILRSLPSSVFYQFTNPTPNYHLDVYYKNVLDSWLTYPQYDPPPTSRLASVESCNFENWNTKGTCSFSFSGFQDLFGLNLRLNGLIQKCSTHEFPDIYLECAGDDCPILGKPKYCQDYRDCTSSALCNSYVEMSDDVFEKLNSTRFDLWGRGFIGVNSTNNKCVNYDKFIQDVGKVISIWSQAQGKEKVCAFDMQHFLAVVPTWSSTQVTQQGSLYRLNQLARWNV
jgi:hypothetical protein